MIFLVDDRSTGDLIYLINDTPTTLYTACHHFETRPRRVPQNGKRAAGTDRSGGYATGTGGAKSGRCLLG
jgi:hypothetical protein